MPMYEYACGECGTHLEVRQRISEDPLTTCPRCETDTLERLVSMSSFALKGGGWYADGYGNGKKAPEATTTESKPKADKDAKTTEKKAEPKPESKTTDSGSTSSAAASS